VGTPLPLHIVGVASMRSCLVSLVVLLCAAIWQNAARAADFKCVRPVGTISEEVRKRILTHGITEMPTPGTCTAILIDGEIVAGDADRFRETLREKQPWISTVFLVSPGGNMAEALAIGRLGRELINMPIDRLSESAFER
jgi:hypothetical protein